MNPAIQSAIEAVNLRNEPAIYYATVNSANIFRTSLIIVISDSHIFVFNLNGKAKQILSFYEMVGMKVEENTITFKFPKTEYSIYAPDPNSIVDCVFDVLKHVLTQNEQHKLIITNFRVERQKNNGLSALFRLKEIYKNPNLDNFKLMETILMCCQPCVSINQFEDQANFLPHFINILPFCPYIKSVLFTQIDGIDNYEYLIQLSQNELYLKHILIQGPATSKFSEFIRILQAVKNSELFGIGFTDSNLSPDHLNLIGGLIKICGLKSVEFHNAIQSDVLISFYNTFLSSGIFDSIYMMNFSGTKNLNLSQLLPKITPVKILCLANCDLEIYDVLTQISVLSNLKVLDISKNHCSNGINTDDIITFPKSLHTINVNSTDFGPNCVVPLLKFLFAHFETGLKLSIASIAPPESLEWNTIFSYINRCTYRSLVALTWDNNVVHPRLFTFLLKNPYFKSLSLNSCVGRGAATDVMASISLFIQSCKTLTNLSLRGDSSNYIGTNLETLFTYIPESESLETLDLTYSRCGDAGYNQVTSFLNKCSKLKTIVIDGMRPKSAEPVFNLGKLYARIRKDVKVSYPYNDIEKLYSDGVLTKRGLVHMRHHFEIDEGSNSYFLRPFRVYRYFLFDEFPYYLQDDEIKELDETGPIIDEVPPPLPENDSPSQQNTRTEILDFGASNNNASNSRRRNFNYSYAMTPNPQASVWSRETDFAKTLPVGALSAPVSPVGGADAFGDYYRRAGIFDEPIKRVRSPRNFSESRQQVLRPKVNLIKDPDEERSRRKKNSSSTRSRSATSTPKKSNPPRSSRNRPAINDEENENEGNETRKRTSNRKIRSSQRQQQPLSQRRTQREENNDDNDEEIVERPPRSPKRSQRAEPTSKRSKRDQNEKDDENEEELDRKKSKRTATQNSRRSRTPTTSTRKSKKIFDGDEDEAEVRRTPTSKKKRVAQTPNSSSRRNVNNNNSSRRRQKQNDLSDDDNENQVQTTSAKKSTRRRVQKNV